MARTVTHYGSLAAGVGVGASGVASINSVVGAAAKATPGLVKSGLIGAGADLLSEYNQDANLLATMRDRFGWIDTPLSTKIQIIRQSKRSSKLSRDLASAVS